MNTADACWRELAEFKSCTPSPLAFRALVALLDTWPTADREQALTEAEAFLLNWPDATRVAPWSWCKAASKGIVLPTWRLVRSLTLNSDHLTKWKINLQRLAHHADLTLITELSLPDDYRFPGIAFLYQRPEVFPNLKKLRVIDQPDNTAIRVLTDSPIWRTVTEFDTHWLTDSLAEQAVSRIVPNFHSESPLQHVTLCALDLITLWSQTKLSNLRSVSVFIRSVEEAHLLAQREELRQLKSLSIAFRCSFFGSSTWAPFLGNMSEPDEAAANEFFTHARLDQLEALSLVGYSMGYWGREGLGSPGLEALIASGLLQCLKKLHLQLLPLGDDGVALLAPALGAQLETLVLQDVYCKGIGATALAQSPCLTSLHHLDLSGNRIDAESAARLAATEMRNLKYLDWSGPSINPYYWNIGKQPLCDAGAVAWAQSPNVRHLQKMRLSNCHLTDKTLVAIFQSTLFEQLEELDLSHNYFTHAGISETVIHSPLWQKLKMVGLSHCLLDNEAITALTHVAHAPNLRSLQLAYNSIGVAGAKALAGWPALAQVWNLDLHDNYIGDEGLIALVNSPYVGRLLELDLEQDCWNSRRFDLNDQAATALAYSQCLGRLDSIYTGCVDAYHDDGYSPGFSKPGLKMISQANYLRPAARMTCLDFTGISDYIENGPFNESVKFSSKDIRNREYFLDESEAVSERHNLQQLRVPIENTTSEDLVPLPQTCPELPELDFIDETVIEGIEYVEAKPSAETYFSFKLNFQDSQRSLPDQSAKLIADTMQSILLAYRLGSFEVDGGCSDVNHVYQYKNVTFSVHSEPDLFKQLLQEVLWWVGAPENTGHDLKSFPEKSHPALDLYKIDLLQTPATAATTFLQLAFLEVVRLEFKDKHSYRLDRVPFTPAQREQIQAILTTNGVTDFTADWVAVTTNDQGRLTIYIKHLEKNPDFHTLNVRIEVLTPKVSQLIYQLMQAGRLLLLPMAVAAEEGVATTLDCAWPKVKVVEHGTQLHELLSRGPYHWWQYS